MNYYPISSLFFYRLVFMGWLLLGESMFVYHLKRRKGFFWRLSLALLICFGAALAYPIPTSNSFYTMGMFFVLFFVSYGSLFICFQASWKTILVSALCGYTAEQISYEVYLGIYSLINVAIGNSKPNMYSNTSLSLFNGPIDTITYFVSFILIYYLIFLLCARKMKQYPEADLTNVAILSLGVILLVFDIVSSSLVSYYSQFAFDGIYIAMTSFLNAACCVVVLILYYELLYRISVERQYEITNELWKEEKNQYEIDKQTIDLINIKCHDLKYQIQQAGSKNSIPPETVASLTKEVGIYDSVIKTGNRALDVVLSQKSLFCNQHQIRFNCIADGQAIQFLSEEDTYSLFGNIIDNAIEAVKKLEDLSKRVITIRIKRKGNMVSISEENSFEGNIVYRNGMPLTSKKDPRYHGFGLRSIQMVCDKYHGVMEIHSENNVFTISVLFVVGQEQE